MLDLIVENGLVVTPDGPAKLDIGISDGVIADIGIPGSLGDASERLSADGKIVVPGGIDPHVHCSLAIHNPDGTSSLSAGSDVMSRAALHGGTTTLVDFVWAEPEQTLKAAREELLETWNTDSYSDFAFHIVLRGELAADKLSEIPECIEAGFPSFKVFTTNVFPHSPIGGEPLMIEFGSLKEAMELILQHDGIVAVHGEDDDLVQFNYRRTFDEGKKHFRHMPEVHSSLSEDISFRRVIRLAEQCGGTPLYFLHVSAATGVNAIAEARDRGLPVFGETLHQYALHTQVDYHEPDGMKYHTYPSLKTEADRQRLWEGFAEGSMHTFATDGQITSYEEKTTAKQTDNVVGGNAGVEPRMAVVYTEMVSNRGMSLNEFVDATSGNAARILGMYPKKGAIAVGSDADFAVLDPEDRRTISNDMLHESDYTPWEGWDVTVWPSATVLGGQVVCIDGGFSATKGGGKLVTRQLDRRTWPMESAR